MPILINDKTSLNQQKSWGFKAFVSLQHSSMHTWSNGCTLNCHIVPIIMIYVSDNNIEEKKKVQHSKIAVHGLINLNKCKNGKGERERERAQNLLLFLLKSSFCAFNCNFIVSGITIRKAKVKVLYIQLQKGENKLSRIQKIINISNRISI